MSCTEICIDTYLASSDLSEVEKSGFLAWASLTGETDDRTASEWDDCVERWNSEEERV